MYINYSNTFPVIVTDTCEVVFHDDDLVSIFRTNGNSGNYRLSELISIDGKDTTAALLQEVSASTEASKMEVTYFFLYIII